MEQYEKQKEQAKRQNFLSQYYCSQIILLADGTCKNNCKGCRYNNFGVKKEEKQ